MIVLVSTDRLRTSRQHAKQKQRDPRRPQCDELALLHAHAITSSLRAALAALARQPPWATELVQVPRANANRHGRRFDTGHYFKPAALRMASVSVSQT
jgi:hypothetical protein